VTPTGEEASGVDTSNSSLRRPALVWVAVWGVCAVVLAVSWVLAGQQPVADWEASAFEAVNGLSDVLADAIWLPMQVGSFVGMTLFVLGLWALTRRARPALDVAAAALLAWAVGWTIKGIVDRGRPVALLDDLVERATATGSGFVSSHTAVAFAGATVLAGWLPRPWRPVPYAVAALVAFGRLLWGVHLPLDTIGGAAVGVMSGMLVRWLAPQRAPSSAG
jgi:undecaprenyl-diphosphatase